MKDELPKLLEDEPPDADELDVLVEEVYHQELVVAEIPLTWEPSKKKTSHVKKWWKQVITKKKKHNLSHQQH